MEMSAAAVNPRPASADITTEQTRLESKSLTAISKKFHQKYYCSCTDFFLVSRTKERQHTVYEMCEE